METETLWNAACCGGKLMTRFHERASMRSLEILQGEQQIRSRQSEENAMAKVTGIGGVFFKSTQDDKKLAEWYSKNLGIPLEAWGGAVLKWPDDKADDQGLTVWTVAARDSSWFSPSAASFMINYRVDNLDELLAQLRASGVAVHSGPELHENGKFAWIMDPDGNKVELWEPMLWDDSRKK